MSPETAAPHVPVLLAEVIAGLDPKAGEAHVDGTFGAGGYTRAILEKGAARVYAFDRDPDAIEEGEALAASSGGRLTLVPERFSRMRQALSDRGVDAVDGVTLDIGVSSMQLDRAERGFSFQADGPLDMRMAQEGESAADFLNGASEEEIADVIYRYGEEPKSRRIARAIVAARPIATTAALAEIVRKAAGHEEGSGHPHVSGDSHPPERGAAGARRRPRGGGAGAEARRTPRGGDLSQPGRPAGEALPQGAERRRPRRLAASSPPGARRARAQLRGGGEAGARRRRRIEDQPTRPLGDPPGRTAHVCIGMEGRGFGMIARGFKSVIWVATVGGAALSCYMVSLRVATERADLAKVEGQILAAKHDIRSLQTELGTRGRMTQLEDWNANVLALSAPSAAQFVKDDVTLARLERRQPDVQERSAEVHMAAMETGAAAQPPAPAAAAATSTPVEPPKPRVLPAVAHPAPAATPMVHHASYTPEPKSPLVAGAGPVKKSHLRVKAESKPVAKPDRQAKAAPAKASPAAKPEKKTAAVAAPASGPKKLAARSVPAHRPAAQQESDAD
jgi:hypothetical protein